MGDSKHTSSNGAEASSSGLKGSKELKDFGEEFTQSIIEQFKRCLAPIEERMLKFEQQFGDMIEQNAHVLT